MKLIMIPLCMNVNQLFIISDLVELGLIIGKKGRFVKSKDALDYIGGYFLCLDLTSKLLI